MSKVLGFNKGIVSLKGRSRSSVRNRSFLLKEQGLGFKPKIDVNKMLNIKMLCYG